VAESSIITVAIAVSYACALRALALRARAALRAQRGEERKAKVQYCEKISENGENNQAKMKESEISAESRKCHRNGVIENSNEIGK
jgi:hypothetical protein